MMKKMPKGSTIRSKIHAYASKVGLTIVRNHDGSYSIFDNVVGYCVFKNVDMNWVYRTVYDSLSMKIASDNRSLSSGA